MIDIVARCKSCSQKIVWQTDDTYSNLGGIMVGISEIVHLDDCEDTFQTEALLTPDPEVWRKHYESCDKMPRETEVTYKWLVNLKR